MYLTQTGAAALLSLALRAIAFGIEIIFLITTVTYTPMDFPLHSANAGQKTVGMSFYRHLLYSSTAALILCLKYIPRSILSAKIGQS